MTMVRLDSLHANFAPASNGRSLGTPWQPSVDRPVLVIFSIEISVTSVLLGSARRDVSLMSDSSATPTTVRGLVRNQLSGVAATSVATKQLVYLVPKGHYVEIDTTNSSGTGSVSIASQVEIIL